MWEKNNFRMSKIAAYVFDISFSISLQHTSAEPLSEERMTQMWKDGLISG